MLPASMNLTQQQPHHLVTGLDFAALRAGITPFGEAEGRQTAPKKGLLGISSPKESCVDCLFQC